MKTLIRITSFAVVACALAVSNAQAQSLYLALGGTFTNDVTFSAVIIQQGTNGLSHGTNTSYASPVVSSYNTANLISEIGIATTNNFSNAAKLVHIEPSDAFPYFAIIDGANFVNVSKFLNLTDPDQTLYVTSGPDSGVGSEKNMDIEELDFADTNMPKGTLSFKMRGLASYANTYTPLTTNGVTTETEKGKVSGMTGDGLIDGNRFVATGTLSLSGKGQRPGSMHPF